jgi:hypothetical protein
MPTNRQITQLSIFICVETDQMSRDTDGEYSSEQTNFGMFLQQLSTESSNIRGHSLTLSKPSLKKPLDQKIFKL